MSDDDGSSTAPPATGTQRRNCAHCGAFIDPTAWTPVESTTDGDELSIKRFCCEECRQRWIDAHAEEGTETV